jgi:branched-subunit amino acid aminotransferase/4-amino-4-deoxychorismate lyase
MTGFPPILIDGEPASTDDLTYLALVNYGAYTSFRVEDGAARGLGRHLERLRLSSIALFDEPVEEARLRDLMRIAVAGHDACWLRTSLFSPDIGPRKPSWRGVPKVMTSASPSPPPLASAVRVDVQTHVRRFPEIKSVDLHDLIHARRTAQDAGFDDALFVDQTGLISEGSLWNIGFVKGDRVTWPQAPMLAGVTQALIEAGLAGLGLTSEMRPVRLPDLAAFDHAFICNSATPACAVTGIGDHAFSSDPALIERLETAWAVNPPEAI